ncbi:MAG: class I SAM-dependent methyltransferase [Nitrospinota bacterium]|nr:class I SAM-dependent methyltransferase [Nitrospinota bacterium]
MALDTFDRYKNNPYLSPISTGTLEKIGGLCGLSDSSAVIDVTCGKGGAALTLAEKFRCIVTGVEARANFAEEARRRAVFRDLDHFVNIVDAGPDHLPFDDFYFDLALRVGQTVPPASRETVAELSRIVRPGGWIALSEAVWKSGPQAAPGPAADEWPREFASNRMAGMEERITEFREAGYAVDLAELESDTSWEHYYAPQAKAILDNRREYNGSSEAQSTLDLWQKELHFYHTGGGKDSLGYACFLLRCP